MQVELSWCSLPALTAHSELPRLDQAGPNRIYMPLQILICPEFKCYLSDCVHYRLSRYMSRLYSDFAETFTGQFIGEIAEYIPLAMATFFLQELFWCDSE